MLILLGAGCAAVAVDTSRFYRLAAVLPWVWLTSWTAAFALLGVFASRLARKRARLLKTVSLCFCLLTFPVWWLGLTSSDSSKATDPRVAAVQPSPDGRLHAISETYYNIIDHSCRVWLREADGYFARRILIWQMTESGCPRVWFPSDTTISVDPRNGEPIQTSTFDRDRMRVTETTLTPR
ncbi:hypothetical protein ACWIGI_35970 [Nocardia sp. NPDC055321]